MDNRISQLLGSSESKTSVNTDVYTNIEINGSGKLIPDNDINSVLDLTTQFNTERQACTYYRLLGKINPIISNVLFNITGPDSWEIFNSPVFIDINLAVSDTNLTYPESLSNNLKEIEGWYGYYNTGFTSASLCQFIDMEPKRERFSFLPDMTNHGINNWYLTITYPYSADTTHYLINGGLLIVTATNVIVGGKPMTALYVPVSHNLSVGDSVQLSGTTNDGIYDIKRVGLDDGSYKNNFFCIDIIDISVGQNSRMSKIYNDVPSTYYFRKFKKVNTKAGKQVEFGDYDIYKLGFSETIFTDEITQFIFNEEIDVNGLNDNLGRPLSQLYLTTIKTDSNGIFSNISSGLEVPFIDVFNSVIPYLSAVTVVQKIHNVSDWKVSSSASLESNVLISNSDFYGDVVEYNTTTIQEVILSDVQYRFNTINRETTNGIIAGGPRPEGYYYKAHNIINIRQFSSYVEQGNSGSTTGIPIYAESLSDGRYIWRDFLDIGYIDINQPVLNYPFLNGNHYIYQNYEFIIRRQDAFDEWGLFYSTFPADPIGKATPPHFKIKSAETIC